MYEKGGTNSEHNKKENWGEGKKEVNSKCQWVIGWLPFCKNSI